MSAPNTNVERQKRRHRGPLVGILGGLAFVALLFILYLGDTSTPEGGLPGQGATPAIAPDVAPAGN